MRYCAIISRPQGISWEIALESVPWTAVERGLWMPDLIWFFANPHQSQDDSKIEWRTYDIHMLS